MKFMRSKTIYVTLMVMMMMMMMVLVLMMNMILRMMVVVIVVMMNLIWDISSTYKWKCFLKILMIVKERPAFFFFFLLEVQKITDIGLHKFC